MEAALVLPILALFCLGLIQLTLMQQAKLLTEYAAYCAARAGIVWNGNNERMRDAAVIALMPSVGMPLASAEGMGSFKALAAAYQRFRDEDASFQGLEWGEGPKTANGVPLRGHVRVDTLHPSGTTFETAPWKLSGGMEWEELDFDGPDAFPESPKLEEHLARLYDVTMPDPGEAEYRRATVLSIRVRYWYELRVPFANAVLFGAWYAATAASGGAVTHASGHATVSRSDMKVLADLAAGRAGSSPRHVSPRFYVPLSATYSMRMQSNFHRKWLMHR